MAGHLLEMRIGTHHPYGFGVYDESSLFFIAADRFRLDQFTAIVTGSGPTCAAYRASGINV